MTSSPFPTSGGGGAHGSSPFTGGSPFAPTSPSGGAPFSGSSSESLPPTSAPAARLAPSLVMGALSILLSLYLFLSSAAATETRYLIIASIAWVLAGVLGIGTLGWYFTGDATARAEGNYLSVDWKNLLYWATLVVLAVSVVLSAVHIALWFGKL